MLQTVAVSNQTGNSTDENLCMSRLLPMQHHQDSHLQKLSRPVQKLLARPFSYYAIVLRGIDFCSPLLTNAHYFLFSVNLSQSSFD